MEKQNVAQSYKGILFCHKKEVLTFITLWMNLEDVMQNEIHQS
jgi:hypothetical protein